MQAPNDTSIDLRHAEISLITPFPFQARKRFREEGLAELAESVRQHGVLQPLLGRPCPANLKRIELIAGERRLRASALAGKKTVPIIVREISDRDAEEMMLIENLQREDLTEVEEADALWRMLQLRADNGAALYTHENLAAKLGKTVMKIRQAVKLRSAPEKLLTAVEAKTVSASVAAAVARIPDPKAREAAAELVLRPKTQPVPLNFEQTAQMIRADFMAKIPGAGFDPKDAEIVALEMQGGERVRGGSCEDCPFRSGNLPDIAGELCKREGGKGGAKAGGGGIDPQLCTKPSCLAAKQDAQWERTKESHLKDGGRVLNEAEAKKEFSGWDGKLRYDSPFADPEAGVDYSVFGRSIEKKWKQIIDGLPVTWVLARSPKTRKVIKLLDARATAALLKAKWKEEGPSAAELKEVERQKEHRAKELIEQKVDKAQWRLSFNEILRKLSARGLGVSEGQMLFQLALDNAGSDGMTVMGQWLEIKLPKGGHHSGRDYEAEIVKRAKNECTTVNHWLGWAVLASIAHSVKWQGAKSKDLAIVLDELGLDAKQLKADATAQLKAATAKPGSKAKQPEPPKKQPKHERVDPKRDAELTAAADQLNKLPSAKQKKSKEAARVAAWRAKKKAKK